MSFRNDYIPEDVVDEILNRQGMKDGIVKYQLIIWAVKNHVNGSCTGAFNEKFRTTYRNFFAMPRGYDPDFCNKYFGYMDKAVI